MQNWAPKHCFVQKTENVNQHHKVKLDNEARSILGWWKVGEWFRKRNSKNRLQQPMVPHTNKPENDWRFQIKKPEHKQRKKGTFYEQTKRKMEKQPEPSIHKHSAPVKSGNETGRKIEDYPFTVHRSESATNTHNWSSKVLQDRKRWIFSQPSMKIRGLWVVISGFLFVS